MEEQKIIDDLQEIIEECNTKKTNFVQFGYPIIAQMSKVKKWIDRYQRGRFGLTAKRKLDSFQQYKDGSYWILFMNDYFGNKFQIVKHVSKGSISKAMAESLIKSLAQYDLIVVCYPLIKRDDNLLHGIILMLENNQTARLYVTSKYLAPIQQRISANYSTTKGVKITTSVPTLKYKGYICSPTPKEVLDRFKQEHGERALGKLFYLLLCKYKLPDLKEFGQLVEEFKKDVDKEIKIEAKERRKLSRLKI